MSNEQAIAKLSAIYGHVEMVRDGVLLGEIVHVSVAAQLVKKAEASAYLSFPRNEDGLKSIDALREWLNILEGFITKEEEG